MNAVDTLETIASIIAEEYPVSSIQLLEVANHIEPILRRADADAANKLVLQQHWES